MVDRFIAGSMRIREKPDEILFVATATMALDDV
jgi:hypothetical protein